MSSSVKLPSKAYLAFQRVFSQKYLKNIYHEKIKYKPSLGMDFITGAKFEKNLESNIEIVIKKVLNGTYRFTTYRQLLISKGAKKLPREICIPTMRDKVVLAAMFELLTAIYTKGVCCAPPPHSVIAEIKSSIKSGAYNAVIKVDIQQFYSNIDHQILSKALQRRIRKPEIVSLVNSAIETKTCAKFDSSKKGQKRNKGVPEGLSISNALAGIYLMNLDAKYSQIPDIKYFRYVDDIIILCAKEDVSRYKSCIKSDIEKLNLKINEEKTCDRFLSEGFSYLGYDFKMDGLSIKRASIQKLERSLQILSQDYLKCKDKNTVEYWQWKYELKITGCVLQGKRYGWLFFFSQIDDFEILCKLDWLVDNYKSRYNLPQDFPRKRFKKTYYQIRYNFENTTYVPKFDDYGIDDKRVFLSDICKMSGVDKMTDEEVDNQFKKRIFQEAKQLEQDVLRPS